MSCKCERLFIENIAIDSLSDYGLLFYLELLSQLKMREFRTICNMSWEICQHLTFSYSRCLPWSPGRWGAGHRSETSGTSASSFHRTFLLSALLWNISQSSLPELCSSVLPFKLSHITHHTSYITHYIAHHTSHITQESEVSKANILRYKRPEIQ